MSEQFPDYDFSLVMQKWKNVILIITSPMTLVLSWLLHFIYFCSENYNSSGEYKINILIY